tara:strand:+ start:431338 stop:431601 length:264 start_codon:yes stop_codon:yes gene_type:complete
MMHKIGAANSVADKGMDLISKISSISETLRQLAVETEQENLDQIAKQAGKLESSYEEYKASLLSAIQEIAHDSDEFSGIQENDGVRL